MCNRLVEDVGEDLIKYDIDFESESEMIIQIVAILIELGFHEID